MTNLRNSSLYFGRKVFVCLFLFYGPFYYFLAVQCVLRGYICSFTFFDHDHHQLGTWPRTSFPSAKGFLQSSLEVC